jgi:hypothetical protein
MRSIHATRTGCGWWHAGSVAGRSVQLGSPAPFSARVSLTADGGIMVSIPHGSGTTVHPNASIFVEHP